MQNVWLCLATPLKLHPPVPAPEGGTWDVSASQSVHQRSPCLFLGPATSCHSCSCCLSLPELFPVCQTISLTCSTRCVATWRCVHSLAVTVTVWARTPCRLLEWWCSRQTGLWLSHFPAHASSRNLFRHCSWWWPLSGFPGQQIYSSLGLTPFLGRMEAYSECCQGRAEVKLGAGGCKPVCFLWLHWEDKTGNGFTNDALLLHDLPPPLDVPLCYLGLLQVCGVNGHLYFNTHLDMQWVLNHVSAK